MLRLEESGRFSASGSFWPQTLLVYSGWLSCVRGNSVVNIDLVPAGVADKSVSAKALCLLLLL